MSDFVTLLTVQYPQQLWIIKGKLESEDIVCFVKDELTVQSNNFYSNAIGGVKLQVQQKDAEKAVALLIELGYLKDEPMEIDLLTRLDIKTRSIPFIKNFDVVNRIVILIILAIIVITVVSYYIFK